MLYLRLYADAFSRALKGIGKSPWTLALPLVYVVLYIVAARLVSPLPSMVGGILMTIVADMLASSLLYFVAQAVQTTPARPRELKQSLLEYFWPVVSFGFVYFLASWALSGALQSTPNGDRIYLAILGVAWVLLNVVPEVIYQKTPVGGIAIIMESVGFIQKHWIEWFVPNLAMAAALYGVLISLGRLPFGLFLWPLVGALGYVLFVFRGTLFQLIDRTSPYQLRARYGGKKPQP